MFGELAVGRNHNGADLFEYTDNTPLRILTDQVAWAAHLPGRYSLANSQHEPYDIVVLTGSYDETAFSQYIAEGYNPLAPVIADESFGARADYTLRFHSASEICDAAASLRSCVQRVAELPPIARGAERNATLALGMAYTRQSKLTPLWTPSHRECIRYPLLLGIEEQRAALESLTDAGLLKRQYFDRLHICGRCSSARVHAREVCCSCGSSDLVEHNLLHHYACGLQAPEDVFASRSGLSCPKCRKTLKHYGVEYDKPGQVISCATCDATLAEPDVSFVCADCGEETDSDSSASTRYYEYTLTTRGTDAALAGAVSTNTDHPGSGDELLEFRRMVQNYVHIATRSDRPLTMIRFAPIAASELPRGLMSQLKTLVMETAREGDAVALADDCVLACLPETDTELAQPLLNRVMQRSASQLPHGIDVKSNVVPRDQVLDLLRDVC